MRYETNAYYFIMRYNKSNGNYEVLKRITGIGKKKLEYMLNYYENERYPDDFIFLTKGVDE
ncbi:MAG TPA: hypothetical protein VLA74_01135 [Nitrososphaeraceae archaeon]|nr:hypothetical protein [Nitrososphaeraceae archaeon]